MALYQLEVMRRAIGDLQTYLERKIAVKRGRIYGFTAPSELPDQLSSLGL